MNKIINGVATEYEIPEQRYLKCETLTGEWWYKDMKTGKDLPLFTTPIPEREETKITYETGNIKELERITIDLLQELERYKNIIDELRWKPIEEYEKPKYDWVLVKYFIEPNFECIPCVAENRFGKWYDRNDNLINGEVRYFADMQLLDTLEELKGE